MSLPIQPEGNKIVAGQESGLDEALHSLTEGVQEAVQAEPSTVR
jgi:hypothetical protein